MNNSDANTNVANWLGQSLKANIASAEAIFSEKGISSVGWKRRQAETIVIIAAAMRELYQNIERESCAAIKCSKHLKHHHTTDSMCEHLVPSALPLLLLEILPTDGHRKNCV